MEKVDVYEACDRAIRLMDRDCLREFGMLKTAKWDRLNVIRTVTQTYRRIVEKARKRLREDALETYELIYLLYEEDAKSARSLAQKAVTAQAVDDMLERTDPVTMYRFDAETERKAYRLAEALEVAQNKDLEIDRAMRALVKQLAQYAINFADFAMVAAYRDLGAKKAMWHTQRDNRVCEDCAELNGQVFRIDELPPKPHIGCRCYWTPVFD